MLRTTFYFLLLQTWPLPGIPTEGNGNSILPAAQVREVGVILCFWLLFTPLIQPSQKFLRIHCYHHSLTHCHFSFPTWMAGNSLSIALLASTLVLPIVCSHSSQCSFSSVNQISSLLCSKLSCWLFISFALVCKAPGSSDFISDPLHNSPSAVVMHRHALLGYSHPRAFALTVLFIWNAPS